MWDELCFFLLAWEYERFSSKIAKSYTGAGEYSNETDMKKAPHHSNGALYNTFSYNQETLTKFR